MLEADFLRPLFGHEEPKGVLGRLPLVQEQSPEFFFLDSREGVVHNGQHLKQEHNMLSGTSVTRGLDYLFNVWPLRTMKI